MRQDDNLIVLPILGESLLINFIGITIFCHSPKKFFKHKRNKLYLGGGGTRNMVQLFCSPFLTNKTDLRLLPSIFRDTRDPTNLGGQWGHRLPLLQIRPLLAPIANQGARLDVFVGVLLGGRPPPIQGELLGLVICVHLSVGGRPHLVVKGGRVHPRKTHLVAPGGVVGHAETNNQLFLEKKVHFCFPSTAKIF